VSGFILLSVFQTPSSKLAVLLMFINFKISFYILLFYDEYVLYFSGSVDVTISAFFIIFVFLHYFCAFFCLMCLYFHMYKVPLVCYTQIIGNTYFA